MKKLLQSLNDFWFAAMAPERLAIIRIATGLFSLWYLLARFDMLQSVAANDVALFEPVGLASFLQQPLAPALFSVILYATIALNLCYILGFKFKYVGPLFGVILLFLMSYRNSWSMLYHNYNALVLHIFVVGFVAAADVLSLDAYFRKKQLNGNMPLSHWQYGWPIKLISAITVGAYLLSGLAKVLGNLAWDWVSGNAMRSQVAVDAIRKAMFGTEPTALFEWIYPQTGIFFIMGIGTMILELGAPLALFHRRIAAIWVVLTILMHWGIYFIMDIDFPYHQTGLLFLSFLAVERWWFKIKDYYYQAQYGKSQVAPASDSIVLFDGVCNFCDSTVKFIIDRDKKGRFRFASIQSEVGQALLKQYHAPLDLSTIVLIDTASNRFYTKSSAILRVFGGLTFPVRLLKFFIIIPTFLRDYGYDIFAQRRYQWFGAKSACEIPSLEIQSRFL